MNPGLGGEAGRAVHRQGSGVALRVPLELKKILIAFVFFFFRFSHEIS